MTTRKGAGNTRGSSIGRTDSGGAVLKNNQHQSAEERAVKEPENPQASLNATLAKAALLPECRHAAVSSAFSAGLMGGNDGQRYEWADAVSAMVDATNNVREGDLAVVDRILTSQALTLDSMFTEMSRKAAANLGQYPHAAERYMRLALKAQANSRATLEALMRFHQPREQTVKHVHVNAGGQAVVADEFHHHPGGKNEISANQSHAAGSAGFVAALSRPDPLGHRVPIPSREREEEVQDARRDESRGTEGQQERMETRR